jgi:anti-sigma-K factor RskA
MRLAGRQLEQVAGAYALGSLSPRARRRFEALMARDVAARRAWQQWEARLSEIAPDIPPVRPPASTWPAIEQRLAGKSSSRVKHPGRWLFAAALVVGIAVFVMWRKVRP